MTTQEFAHKFVALSIHDKFSNLSRIQQEFNRNQDKLNPQVKNTQQELIRWMRNTCFEDENFMQALTDGEDSRNHTGQKCRTQ